MKNKQRPKGKSSNEKTRRRTIKSDPLINPFPLENDETMDGGALPMESNGREDSDRVDSGYQAFPRPFTSVSDDGSVLSQNGSYADELGTNAHGTRGGVHYDGDSVGNSDSLPARPPHGGMEYRTASRIIAEGNTQSVINALKELGNLPRPRRDPEVLGATGHELESGLEMLSARRTSGQAARAGVASKHDRGATQHDRLKREQLIVKKLPVTLGVSQIMKMLASDDPEDFNIAVDAQQHQIGLRALREVLYENDMRSPFMIPTSFNLDDPSSVSGPFINILEEPDRVPLEVVLEWSRFLRKFAARVEIESASWAGKIIDLSMEPELKARVHDDLEELPDDCKSGVTLFKLAWKHMVMQSQEVLDALQEYLRTWDIRTFNDENVTVACTQLKAVLRALGSNIPSNAPRLILEGFKNAKTPEFVQLCVALGTTLSSSLLQSQQQANMSIKALSFQLLQDLEGNFIGLRTQRRWKANGHGGKAYRATLPDKKPRSQCSSKR